MATRIIHRIDSYESPRGKDNSLGFHSHRNSLLPKGHQPPEDNILVVVRTRHLLESEKALGCRDITHKSGDNVLILDDPGTTAIDDYLRLNKTKEKRFAFDQVFDPSSSQRDVYQKSVKFLIPGVFLGFNATVFAYGATGAGKTYTMLGDTKEGGDLGIMYLALVDLFEHVHRIKADHSSTPNTKEDNLDAVNSDDTVDSREALRGNPELTPSINVKCSFLEVYNENLRDLLSSPSGDYLDLREDPVKGMCVTGSSEVEGLESVQEIIDLLDRGHRNRTTEPTGMNVTSSRSHAVLQVVVEQRENSSDVSSQLLVGKLSLIDLAGSERASQTQNTGIRMLEGANINRSLLALGNCITALSEKAQGKARGGSFVPYRDSKLTRLLKDSLGGNCRTVMIANVSPCHANYEDTSNTLKYANRAKNIRVTVKRNVVKVNHRITKYTEIISELRGVVSELRHELAVKDQKRISPKNIPDYTPLNHDRSTMKVVPDEGDQWKQQLTENIEERVHLKRELIETGNEWREMQTEKQSLLLRISKWEHENRQASDNSFETNEVIEDGVLGSPEKLKQELKDLQDCITSIEITRDSLLVRIRENDNVMLTLQKTLKSAVHNEGVRAFLQLLLRNQVLEVEAMESAEQNRRIEEMNKKAINQKDLEIERLKHQVKIRDRMLSENRALLNDTQMKDSDVSQKRHTSFLPLDTTDLSEISRGTPYTDRGISVYNESVLPRTPKDSSIEHETNSRGVRRSNPPTTTTGIYRKSSNPRPRQPQNCGVTRGLPTRNIETAFSRQRIHPSPNKDGIMKIVNDVDSIRLNHKSTQRMSIRQSTDKVGVDEKSAKYTVPEIKFNIPPLSFGRRVLTSRHQSSMTIKQPYSARATRKTCTVPERRILNPVSSLPSVRNAT